MYKHLPLEIVSAGDHCDLEFRNKQFRKNIKIISDILTCPNIKQVTELLYFLPENV